METAPHSAAAPDRVRHVVIVYTDAGSGHRQTAEALRGLLEDTGRYRITLVNAYQEVLPHLDLFARVSPRTVEQTYNEVILHQGRTGLACLAFYLAAVVNVLTLSRSGRRAFTALWERTAPDLVISVLPMINHLIRDSLAGWRGGRTPFAVLMTDWAEMTRGVWFPRSGDYNIIAGTEATRAQIARMGHPPERAFAMEGLLTRPVFLAPPPCDRAAARRALGLDPDRPVVCMMYGGQGSARMVEMAEALRADPPDIQLVALCGRNAALAEAFRATALPFPMIALGFSREVHRWMAASDVFVGKTGPLSVSEAVACGLPLLIDRRNTLPQERPVLEWIRRTNAGAVFDTPKQFAAALRVMLAEGRPARPPATNRAAHQIPDIVARIADQATP